jgi:hypothetical protein
VGIAKEHDRRTVEVPQLLAASNGAPLSVDSGEGKKSVPTMAYVLGGTGIVLLGVGVAARFVANSAMDDRRAQCLQEASATCDGVGVGKVHAWEGISFAAFGLGAASIGGALYLYFSAAKEEAPKAPTAYLRIAPTAGGFQLQGAF